MGAYVPSIVCVPVPTADGVYVTWQVAVPAIVPADRLQLAAGVKVPAPSLVKLTDPVGVVAPVAEVSVIVAVQTVPVLTLTDAGTQLTLVEVE